MLHPYRIASIFQSCALARVPVEVLVMIFIQLLPTSPSELRDWLTITWVHWRAVVISKPNLWTSIDIGLSLMYQNAVLERTRGKLLDVSMSRPLDRLSLVKEIPTLDSPFEVCLKAVSSARSLILSPVWLLTSSSTPSLLEIVTKAKTQLPLTELTFVPTFAAELATSHTQASRSSALLHLHALIKLSLKVPCSIHTIHLEFVPAVVRREFRAQVSLIKRLEGFPALNELTLKGLCANLIPAEEIEADAAELKELHTLVLIDVELDALRILLRALRLPKMTSLTIVKSRPPTDANADTDGSKEKALSEMLPRGPEDWEFRVIECKILATKRNDADGTAPY
ncbi:hypothetical protein SISNIDRAFT_488085 [Sistotremastrum niveocremeum HHB9708]|uniref:F-box domain-containing protein n=1 Tax=Sistotremastrum niveocremeum HHB9708 TaxID=1314777 RepID=A0A164RQV4_9AGAM|nr:hypothetical protein SISNIDRAFT_488085 [Sistotremastrum niveocremeum HHB9708]